MSFDNSFAPINANARTVLDPEDAKDMYTHGLVTQPVGGKLRVNKRRLREPSSSEDSTIALESSPITSPSVEDVYNPVSDSIEIPFVLDSPEFVEFLGFSKERAQIIFSRWYDEWCIDIASPAPWLDRKRSLIDFTTDYIQDSEDLKWCEMSKWADAMSQFGFSAQLINIFTDPRCDTIKFTMPLSYWLIDTCQMRHRVLLGVAFKSIERKNYRQEKKQKTSAATETLGSSRVRGPHASTTRIPASQALQDLSDASPAVAQLPRDVEPLPGHRLLWKGIDFDRTRGLLEDDGKLRNISVLLSTPPTDFSGKIAHALYLTESKTIAEMYAEWALLRIKDQSGDVCLMVIQIPDETLGTLDKEELYYGDDWKKVVHLSRSNEYLTAELENYEKADYIRGNICSDHSEVIAALPSWKDINRSNVLREPNSQKFATQDVFASKCRHKLQVACKNTVVLVRSEYSLR